MCFCNWGGKQKPNITLGRGGCNVITLQCKYSCFQTHTGTLNICRHYQGELHMSMQTSESDGPHVTRSLSCEPPNTKFRVSDNLLLCMCKTTTLHNVPTWFSRHCPEFIYKNSLRDVWCSAAGVLMVKVVTCGAHDIRAVGDAGEKLVRSSLQHKNISFTRLQRTMHTHQLHIHFIYINRFDTHNYWIHI